jgi:hypothetical protein
MESVRGAITQAERERKRAFTPKQKKFLKLYAENDFQNAKEIAEKAGYKGHYWNLVNSLKDEIKTISETILVAAAPEAAASLVATLNSDKPIPNAQNKLLAAKEVLDRSGVVKIDKQQVDIGVSGGVFLMPVKHELKEPIDVEYAEYVEEEDGS